MKLFCRQHLPFVFSYIILGGLIMGIIWLDGYREIKLLLYALLLGVFVLGVFLIYSYFTQKNLYKTLSSETKTEKHEEIMLDSSAISQAVSQLLQKQYEHHFQEVKKITNARDKHVRFIHQWIHQMKTPVSVIELMAQDEEINAQSLLEECDKLKEGLNFALNMARLESFQQDFVIEKVQLKSIAKQAVSEHKRNFIRNYVYPKIEIDEHLFVETDEKWLAFILYQILSNSIKYSAHSEKNIVIGACKKNENTILQITDYGEGIQKSDLPRVFQPFFTGEAGRNHHEATGMGLYLVAEICRELHHTVEIDSKLGEYTTVSIIF